MKLLSAIAFGLCASTASAGVFLEFRPKLDVNPVRSSGQFEVIERPSSDNRDVWCAAGRYARDALGVKNRGRLYLAGASGPAETVAGRKGVRFSIEPVAGQGAKYSPSITKVGTNWSVAMALSHCYDPLRTTYD